MATQATQLSELTIAVIAGGLGTRLRSVVADRPKALAEIHKLPFLAYLLDQLAAAGCRSVVLCTGYRGDQIAQTFGDNYGPLRLRYSQEQEPLGTAGALRLAMTDLHSDPVLVMNGDSYCGIDLNAYWEWHYRRHVVASMVLARVVCSGRYGAVRLDHDSCIAEFAEKQDNGEGWINAGIYLLGQRVLQSIPEGAGASLERDIFPKWIGRGLYGYPSPSPFIDIGTPADFAAAETFFSSLKTRGGLNYGY